MAVAQRGSVAKDPKEWLVLLKTNGLTRKRDKKMTMEQIALKNVQVHVNE